MPKTIRNASFTKLDDFTTCRYKARLKYIDKSPQPPRVPPPGKAEHPMERGIRVHDQSEVYITKQSDTLIPELRKFDQELLAARGLHEQGKATCEQLWRFDQNWQPLADDDWSAYWYIKLDLEFDITRSHKGVADIKTGKSGYNAVKHASQVQLYCIGTLMRYLDVELVTGELWYVDENKVSRPQTVTRKEAVMLARAWKQRAKIMTDCTVFPANPNKRNCRFCDYGTENGTGACQFDAYRVS